MAVKKTKTAVKAETVKTETVENVKAEIQSGATETVSKKSVETHKIKVKVLKQIRASYGAFDKGDVVEVDVKVFDILAKNQAVEAI